MNAKELTTGFCKMVGPGDFNKYPFGEECWGIGQLLPWLAVDEKALLLGKFWEASYSYCWLFGLCLFRKKLVFKIYPGYR